MVQILEAVKALSKAEAELSQQKSRQQWRQTGKYKEALQTTLTGPPNVKLCSTCLAPPTARQSHSQTGPNGRKMTHGPSMWDQQQYLSDKCNWLGYIPGESLPLDWKSYPRVMIMNEAAQKSQQMQLKLQSYAQFFRLSVEQAIAQ